MRLRLRMRPGSPPTSRSAPRRCPRARRRSTGCRRIRRCAPRCRQERGRNPTSRQVPGRSPRCRRTMLPPREIPPLQAAFPPREAALALRASRLPAYRRHRGRMRGEPPVEPAVLLPRVMWSVPKARRSTRGPPFGLPATPFDHAGWIVRFELPGGVARASGATGGGARPAEAYGTLPPGGEAGTGPLSLVVSICPLREGEGDAARAPVPRDAPKAGGRLPGGDVTVDDPAPAALAARRGRHAGLPVPATGEKARP